MAFRKGPWLIHNNGDAEYVGEGTGCGCILVAIVAGLLLVVSVGFLVFGAVAVPLQYVALVLTQHFPSAQWLVPLMPWLAVALIVVVVIRVRRG